MDAARFAAYCELTSCTNEQTWGHRLQIFCEEFWLAIETNGKDISTHDQDQINHFIEVLQLPDAYDLATYLIPALRPSPQHSRPHLSPRQEIVYDATAQQRRSAMSTNQAQHDLFNEELDRLRDTEIY